MPAPPQVRLTPKLVALIETWDADDQDVLLGLIAAIRSDGLDVIIGASRATVAGLTVEFIEPGETPDMVWARLFTDLRNGPFALFLYFRDPAFVLDF